MKISLRGRLRSIGFAAKGIFRAFRSEQNMWIHAASMILVIAAGFHFDIRPYEWIVVLIAIAMVLITEMMNTAIEELADRLTREKDPMIARAKDIAAGAVLLSALLAIAIGLIVFLPYFSQAFSG